MEQLKLIWDALQDKKAYAPSILDLTGLRGFTDYFVICSADSGQQIKAIAQYVQEKLHLAGLRQKHQEGDWDAQWVLLDYGDIIVHIFHKDARYFYNLEELWANAPRLEF